MKTYSVPARYAPEVDRAMRSIIRSIEFDMAMRSFDDKPTAYVETDESRTGSIIVVVGGQEVAPFRREFTSRELSGGDPEIEQKMERQRIVDEAARPARRAANESRAATVVL